jgi:hypothetical protein
MTSTIDCPCKGYGKDNMNKKACQYVSCLGNCHLRAPVRGLCGKCSGSEQKRTHKRRLAKVTSVCALDDHTFHCESILSPQEIIRLETNLKNMKSDKSNVFIDSANEMFIDHEGLRNTNIRAPDKSKKFTGFNGIDTDIKDKLLKMIENTIAQLSKQVPHNFIFSSFSLIYQWGSPGQLWHIDLKSDSYQICIVVTNDSPTTIVSKATTSSNEAVVELGMQSPCGEPFFFNYCPIVSSFNKIKYFATPMSKTNVDSGTVCVSKGGQIHAGPIVENEKFRALLFFTVGPNGQESYDSNEQYNIFGFVDRLVSGRHCELDRMIVFLKSQLVMYLQYFSIEQLKLTVEKLSRKMNKPLLSFLKQLELAQ